MPVIKSICTLIIGILVAGSVALVVPTSVHANTEPRCEVASKDNPEIGILEGQMIAVGTTVRVKCHFDQLPGDPTWTAKSELVGPMSWAVVDLVGPHDLVPYDLSENAVDLSQYEGTLVLNVEGVVPPKKATAPVWPISTDGTASGPFVTDTAPNEVRRLISFGHGAAFDGPHTERTVIHPLALAVQERLSLLDGDNLTSPLGKLATKLLEEGRPWDAERLVSSLEATSTPTSPWIWISIGAVTSIFILIVLIMIYLLIGKPIAGFVSKLRGGEREGLGGPDDIAIDPAIIDFYPPR